MVLLNQFRSYIKKISAITKKSVKGTSKDTYKEIENVVGYCSPPKGLDRVFQKFNRYLVSSIW